jgi:hypothetical protein
LPFWTHSVNGQTRYEEPTIAEYLPENYHAPTPPATALADLSESEADSECSDESCDEGSSGYSSEYSSEYSDSEAGSSQNSSKNSSRGSRRSGSGSDSSSSDSGSDREEELLALMDQQTGDPIVQGDESVPAVDGSNGALVTVETEPETEPDSALAAWPSDEQQQQQQQQEAVLEYNSNGGAVVVYAQQTVSVTAIKLLISLLLVVVLALHHCRSTMTCVADVCSVTNMATCRWQCVSTALYFLCTLKDAYCNTP